MKLFGTNRRKILLITVVAIAIIALAVIYPIFQLRTFKVEELGFKKYEDLIGNPEDAHSDQEAVEPGQEHVEAISEFKQITVEEVYEIWSNNEDYTILDVRTLEEYSEGHIEGAVLIPDIELKDRLDELPKDKPIIVHCCGPDCGRSEPAAKILVENGFSEVYEMTGGLLDWKEKGYPIVIGEGIYEKEYGLIYSEPGFKEFNIKLIRYNFFPEVIRVDKGDRVRLNLDSVDIFHGIAIDGYDINVSVPKEKIVTIEFIAIKAGSIKIRCSIPCGPFHPFMIGNIVVSAEKSSLNIDFLWAIILAVIVPLSTLGMLLVKNKYNKKREKD